MEMKKNILLLLFFITYLSFCSDMLVPSLDMYAYSTNVIEAIRNDSDSIPKTKLIKKTIGSSEKDDIKSSILQSEQDLQEIHLYDSIKGSKLTSYKNTNGTSIGLYEDEAPCQVITSQLDSSSPEPNDLGYIIVCPNEPITLNGSATFSESDTGATYEWNLGNGNTIVGQDITFSYDTPGVYRANLNVRDNNQSIDPLGCANTNLINQVILVSTDPNFEGTVAENEVICLGESTTIEGVANAVEFFTDCTLPESEVTFLPDGSGVSYETAISLECYDPLQTLTDINQILNVCLTMEHSYLSDLSIALISPSGQEIKLKKQVGGGSANLGFPWATGFADTQSGNDTPGIGSQYCFVPGNANPTLVGGILPGGVFISGDGPGTYTDSYVPAGNYRADEPFTGLLGSPFNGDWIIKITDHKRRDNGYIFEWSIDFAPEFLLPEISFTPEILTQAWDEDPTIISSVDNTITVKPTESGIYCYKYRVTNDFGCEYFKEVCVEVLDNAAPDLVAQVTTAAFTGGNVVEAQASGAGTYEYSIDGGEWQSSGTFTNVALGEHTILAREIHGCGLESMVKVMVLDYPRYFTPNGDGYHDTWNINGLSNQLDSKIYIYDRYGKLLKQISPSGAGWDGSFNGRLMPTNDYWFTVEYDDLNTDNRKVFKSHFTLKR